MTSRGWLVGLSGVGLILVAIGTEFSQLGSWAEATTPAFIGKLLLQLGGAAASFLGGKMIPTQGEEPRP